MSREVFIHYYDKKKTFEEKIIIARYHEDHVLHQQRVKNQKTQKLEK